MYSIFFIQDILKLLSIFQSMFFYSNIHNAYIFLIFSNILKNDCNKINYATTSL